MGRNLWPPYCLGPAYSASPEGGKCVQKRLPRRTKALNLIDWPKPRSARLPSGQPIAKRGRRNQSVDGRAKADFGEDPALVIDQLAQASRRKLFAGTLGREPKEQPLVPFL